MISSDLVVGLLLGAVAGAVLIENCKPAKDIVTSASDEVKSKIQAVKKAKKVIENA